MNWSESDANIYDAIRRMVIDDLNHSAFTGVRNEYGWKVAEPKRYPRDSRTIDSTWRECTPEEYARLHKPGAVIPYWKDGIRPTVDRRKVIYKNRPW